MGKPRIWCGGGAYAAGIDAAGSPQLRDCRAVGAALTGSPLALAVSLGVGSAFGGRKRRVCNLFVPCACWLVRA